MGTRAVNKDAKALLKRKARSRPTAKAPAKVTKSKSQKSQSVRVNVDDLQWKSVEVPEKMDDLEGFFGLEEIEGVSVHKTDDGKVEFVSSSVSEKEQPVGSPEPESEDDGAPAVQHEEPAAAAKKAKKASKPKKERHVSEAANKGIESVEFSALDSVDIDDDGDVPDQWGMSLTVPIRKATAKLQFNAPTDIQRLAIPEIIAGKDVIGKASTGSGKTLAYGIPILENHLQLILADGAKAWPTGLIFAPTRELVHQICDHLKKISQFISFEATGSSGIVPITGGLAIEKQQRLLSKRPAIVVATPGRFLEVFTSSNSMTELLSKAETLVLDEADRLAQGGHFEELDKILDHLSSNPRQKLVFSATFQSDLLNKLAKRTSGKSSKKEIIQILKKKLDLQATVEFIDASPAEAVASSVVESIIECGAMEKDLYLYYFLLAYPERSMVFVNSIDAVKRITPLLKELGVPAFALHSGMMQKQRLRSLERFKAEERGVLIATDVAARGLDIPLVSHVVHYHVPRAADTYVHRSGRTARAGHQGVSVVLCSPPEVKALRKLRQVVKSELQMLEVDYDIVRSVRDRVQLAKEIADSQIGTGRRNNWLQQAAEDLGADLDELDDDDEEDNRLSNQELKIKRAELRHLLSQPIGRRSQYITSGTTNVAHMIVSGQGHEAFLGRTQTSALEKLSQKSRRKATKP